MKGGERSDARPTCPHQRPTHLAPLVPTRECCAHDATQDPLRRLAFDRDYAQPAADLIGSELLPIGNALAMSRACSEGVTHV